MATQTFEHEVDALIDRALAEDLGPGDVTTLATVPVRLQAEGRFLAKEAGVLAGLKAAERVFNRTDPALRVQWTRQDGEAVEPGTVFGSVAGPARGIVSAERLALNLLQRMSGIATATRRMVESAGRHHVRILDTRKTAPGLRLFDKWAVRLGGGANHRHGLYDMVLIKDNHKIAAGGVRQAIEAARRYLTEQRLQLEVEVEAHSLDEVREILAVGGVNRILLDNMVRVRPEGIADTSMLAEAVRLIDGRVRTEASGNVTLQTVDAIAATGVDDISAGSLTHSVTALDISLKIRLEG